MEAGAAMRVVHWNLRRCIDPISGSCSLARVQRTVERLRPTILTLNEVDLSKTPSLLEDLAPVLPHASFFGHVSGSYGNALLSTEPLRDIVHTPLNGGSEVRTREGTLHRIHRGSVHAVTSISGVSVCILATHLDHMDQSQRHTQMEHVLQTVGAPAGSRQQLIVGDLNALQRGDYTNPEWAAHEEHNKVKGWASPSDDSAGDGGCLAMLAGAGFIDTFASVHERPSVAGAEACQQVSGGEWRESPWTAHTRVVGGPRYRIDYVWSRPPLSGGYFVPVEATVDHDCGGASDHQPVVIDFRMC